MGKGDKKGQETRKSVSIVKIKTAKKEDLDKVDGGSSPSSKGAVVTNTDSNGFDSNICNVRSAFLRCLAGIYFCAFLSIYLQIEGLYGNNGVTPVKAELQLSSRSADACFKDKLTILCYIPGYLGINGQYSMELVALLGVVFSGLGIMCVHCCVAPVFAFLWVLYFSIYSVGNVFLWFQWDILLLETGILAIIAAPWFPTKSALQSKPRDLISLWMIKWLTFRLMFASGVVKLQSGCPTWWGLSALNHHFESQCLPTPLAYYAHQLPAWILKLGVVGTYYIEILVPFAFFAPFAILRKFSFWFQVLFQITIILTGNYTFFNLLTMVLCLSLLDGDFFGKSKNEQPRFSIGRVLCRTFSFSLIGLSLYYTWIYFGLALEGQTVTSKPNFKNVQFNAFISMAVPYSIALAFLILVSTISHTIIISVVDVRGAWSKVKSLLSVVIYGVICVALFCITLVPYSALHKETNQSLPEQIRSAYVQTSKFHLTSSYGLFRRMTGTDGGRPEVILEHANDLNGPWGEYQFLYKPGNVSAAPAFIVPHQPRLDWQMWFAALGTYHDTPWLVSLAFRLLQGEPAVRNLLDPDHLPTPIPKYIRATSYRYQYTSLNEKTQDWWKRKKEKEFLPIYSVSHSPLVEFIKKLNYLEPDTVPKETKPNEGLVKVLDIVRESTASHRPEYIIWGAIFSLLVIIFSSKIF